MLPLRPLGRVLLVHICVGAGGASADDSTPTPEQARHWAWEIPARTAAPVAEGPFPSRDPVDAFVLARLADAGLEPASPAAREQLIRRVSFDLLGLPPAPGETAAFADDPEPDAYEKVVDRSLASPAYGERWGRHWLDLARYADTNGYEHDEVRPDAWRYRDYVIRSLNDDKPYDRFVQEQIAGDELYPQDPDALIATGFNLLGPDMTDAESQGQRRQNTLDDITDTTALVFLGLTMACARCHDHKFEPIPQEDYYRLQAFFAPASFRANLVVAGPEERAAYDRAMRRYRAVAGPLAEEFAALVEPYRARLREAEVVEPSEKQLLAAMSPEHREEFAALKEGLDALKPFRPAPLPVAPGLAEDGGEAPRTFVLHRGELGRPRGEVAPGWPAVLTPGARPAPAPVSPRRGSTGRRSALAEWVVGPENPLAARVMVNRLWQHLFGEGIVATPSDFGLRGARPTHPELLDWLAVEFVRGGWSVKSAQRTMLLSAAYRRSSVPGDTALARDPDNKLLARMNRKRLEGEAVRDTILAVAGTLNREMGGPGVFPPLPAEMTAGGIGGWKPDPNPADHARRSVYVFARRNMRYPFLEVFDFPDSNLSCPERERSTTAPQSLALLNSSVVAAAADALAERLEREAGSAPHRIALAYRLTLGRAPTAGEAATAAEFLRESPLREFCRALFNLNEFVYVD